MNYKQTYKPEPQESGISMALKVVGFIAMCVLFAWVIVEGLSK